MLRESREGGRAELDQDVTEYLGGKLAELGFTFGETSWLFRRLKDKESRRDRCLNFSVVCYSVFNCSKFNPTIEFANFTQPTFVELFSFKSCSLALEEKDS